MRELAFWNMVIHLLMIGSLVCDTIVGTMMAHTKDEDKFERLCGTRRFMNKELLVTSIIATVMNLVCYYNERSGWILIGMITSLGAAAISIVIMRLDEKEKKS